VVEVVTRVVCHAEATHDRPGRGIGRRRHGHDLVQTGRYGQADETEEVPRCPLLLGPQTETALVETRLDPVYQSIALLAGKCGRELLHDHGIRVHGGEGRTVGVAPAAQLEP